MISLRPAEESDRHLLLEWRNDPETRTASLNHAAVSDQEHDAWFSRALIDPNIVVYIGELDDEPIGTVRFDRVPSAKLAEVSINLSPAHRGAGHSRPLLELALEAVRPEIGTSVSVLARIRPENLVSLHVFERLGFRIESVDVSGVGLYVLSAATPADPS